MKCTKCGAELNPEEAVKIGDRILCEDCYFDEAYKVKACDPWAVYSAKQMLKISGAKAEEILTEEQKRIYNFIKSKGKATIEELLNQLKIPRSTLEAHLATLRHLELVKGRKEENKTYIVPFQT